MFYHNPKYLLFANFKSLLDLAPLLLFLPFLFCFVRQARGASTISNTTAIDSVDHKPERPGNGRGSFAGRENNVKQQVNARNLCDVKCPGANFSTPTRAFTFHCLCCTPPDRHASKKKRPRPRPQRLLHAAARVRGWKGRSHNATAAATTREGSSAFRLIRPHH